MQIVDHSGTERENLSVLLCKKVDIVVIEVKELHVVNVVSELVETYVRNCVAFLVVVHFLHTAALNVPQTESRVDFRLALLYFMFLVNAFQQTAFPPLYVLPDLVLLDVGLEVDLFSLLVEKVVGK
jgi:hypothetical protein